MMPDTNQKQTGNQQQAKRQNILQLLRKRAQQSIADGDALLRKFAENQIQTYSQFRKLSIEGMMVQIGWVQLRRHKGFQNQFDQPWCDKIIETLKTIKQQENERRRNVPGIITTFTDWLHSLRDSDSTPVMNLLISRKGSTATKRKSQKVLNAKKTKVEQEEETKPLKWE